MNETTRQLIEDYKKEYTRVNGRTPTVAENHGWITIDTRFGPKFRISEIRNALGILKGRADFYPKTPPTLNNPNP